MAYYRPKLLAHGSSSNSTQDPIFVPVDNVIVTKIALTNSDASNEAHVQLGLETGSFVSWLYVNDEFPQYSSEYLDLYLPLKGASDRLTISVSGSSSAMSYVVTGFVIEED